MKILGIVAHTLGYGDAAAALSVNGLVVGAAEEERFSRIRYDDSFPIQTIKWLLESQGLQGKDIDLISVHVNPWSGSLRRLYWLLRGFPRNISGFLEHWHYYTKYRKIQPELYRELGITAPIVACEHHMCHAATAVCASGFEQTAFMTLDGAGEGETGSWGIGTANGLKRMGTWHYPHSLGLFYSAVGDHLGFPPPAGPGKIMGLAAYGNPQRFLPFLRQVAFVRDGKFTIDLRYMRYQLNLATPHSNVPWVSTQFEKECGFPRRLRDETEATLKNVHMDMAAALQARTNEICLELAEFVRKQTGQQRLCLSGGVALNSVMNGALDESGVFDEVYVFPAPGDAGNAIGSTLVAGMKRGISYKGISSLPYCGPEYSDEELATCLDGLGISARKVESPPEEAAAKIVSGEIVGWFQGRMEFGPRALGNRSILADPRGKDMKDILNNRVKHREWFRPFAPSVPIELFDRFFCDASPDPYMLKVAKVRPQWQEALPAITHTDGTARVQAVRREDNPLYHELMLQMEKQGGLPVVLNTSFNDQEPIVCTPNDAARCYLGTQIDSLIMGPFMAEKTNE